MIWWLIFGLVAGALAKLIMPGKDPGGFIVTILIGIGGSFLGGFIGKTIGVEGVGSSDFSLTNLTFSILGALVILFIWKKFISPKL
ncbi:MAG: GlsB/YeaQ/YmgE family stress response membrane protein [Flavobacteriales bacterium]|nr:GlsB/YeaQ/YmgE family stress response membrane protein [Flavobacteriales bacterium]